MTSFRTEWILDNVTLNHIGALPNWDLNQICIPRIGSLESNVDFKNCLSAFNLSSRHTSSIKKYISTRTISRKNRVSSEHRIQDSGLGLKPVRIEYHNLNT